MVRTRLLLTALVLGLLAAVLAPAGAAVADPCSTFGHENHTCTIHGKIHGPRLDLHGHEHTPGGPSNGGGDGNGNGFIHTGQDPNAPIAVCTVYPLRPPCKPLKPGKPGKPLDINDLASFTPRAGVDHMEPHGWTVVNLDTNFYATTPSELERGTLLGHRAQVRFIPVGWRWSYGDGTSATLGSPGATWASQGIQPFDPTATSHMYRAVGDYTITLSIEFGAEYEWAGQPWQRVTGTIGVPTNPLSVHVGTAKTVLVNHDCLANPLGPGC